jgi:hypothetical protein
MNEYFRLDKSIQTLGLTMSFMTSWLLNIQLVLSIVALGVSCNTFATPVQKVIFYLDRTTANPVIRLDQITPLPDGLRAILAMYALQNGAGCSGGNETISCAFTNALELEGQCSASHLNLVRTWFRQGIPDMGGYHITQTQNIDEPSFLENICYRSPDTATFQRIWDPIQIDIKNNRVHIKAKVFWLARDRSGSLQYSTLFEIQSQSIRVIRHNKYKF